ncbi:MULTISPECIES: methyltransferase domain-containing protein [unclassified Bradyrhizobium]|uniref:class I SAM-dependent methyltransferase n=1 Tax=unclassified Bradyrhizobium TaxID=2631580 RepID=UPI001FFB187E|nr:MULTISPECIES: methyltransferase domain-containing protein [unclassified Bradyrhizobium]MCK1328786.1 methyltransferase domain-containing protein [Bradyrhizobium sp. CW9]MCK1693438.1 methyltransferase domain-containing protein [Bradyrhizobium sp. 144]
MAFDVDIVVLSNIEKNLGPDIECRVGAPNSNPWSLPFAHKKVFSDNVANYDVFVYSEDDILITERNLRAFLKASELLPSDEIAGFLRVEFGSDRELNYPDVHAHFHWDPSSVKRHGEYTLAHFTNEHAASYVLTRNQLRRALDSGKFDVGPHEGKYDLPCSAATDPYTQCGLKKLIPISHLDEFTVHHMSNRYVGSMGVSADGFDRQINVLMGIANGALRTPRSQFSAETRLFRATYSKDYYEPVMEQIASRIPSSARNVLSIGCGSGRTESWLAQQGLRVAAIPLDPVIASSATASGIEIISEDIEGADPSRGDRFDCVLCLNILHLVREPTKLLLISSDFMQRGATLVIQSPNMMSLRGLRSLLRGGRSTFLTDYETAGTHFSSAAAIRRWCTSSGLKVDGMSRILANRDDGRLGMASTICRYLPASLSSMAATSILASASKPYTDGRHNPEVHRIEDVVSLGTARGGEPA